MAVPTLSLGAIESMHYERECKDPVVQVIDIKRIATQQPDAPDRYRLVVSDGAHYQQAILATNLNSLVQTDVLKNNAVVKLKNFLSNMVHNRRVAIIIEMDIVGEHTERIGNPISAEQAFADVKPSSGAPTGSSMASTTMGGRQAPPASSVGAGSSMGGGMGGQVPPDSHVVAIEHLHPYQNKWTIKARVTQKSDMRTWNKPTSQGKLFSFTVLDKSGDEIKITAFNEDADRWFSIIQQGSVYYISKGNVKLANQKWATTSSRYEITLKKDSEIMLCADGDTTIETQHFNFVKISEIVNKDKDAVIDIIGVVVKINELGSVISKARGNTIPKRDIVLMDETQNSVQLTLWGNRAESFNYTGHPVIAIKGARVSDFGGRSLSTMSSSQMQVAPDIPEAAELKGWFETSGASLDQATSISTGGGGRSRVIKTIAQVESEKLGHGEKPDWFWIRATVTYIKSDGTLWYTACPRPVEGGARTCNKKVVETSQGVFRCERCQQESADVAYRWILSMSAADHTGSFWLSAFDDVGPIVIGKKALEMHRLREANDPAFEQAFEEATFRAYNLKLRAKVDTYKDEERVRYTVVQASPIDYVKDSNALLERIEKYGA